ncbi:MAG: ThiF family adenylyltransferase [Thermoanaerobaculaceae bacterium]|jgi:molybdopterin/thiamine biosynthesis adenylyltransferase|nr:ThiF family adenylyltransferase [Thermoanaerobaculaceae bacterium]
MPDTEYSSLFLDRTQRLIGPAAVACLRDACVLVAGCGGVGGATAVLLARMGIGRFVLADPGCFDPPDANRQWAADTSAMGANKAEHYAGLLTRINPEVRIEVVPEGVRADNVAALVEPADIVVDGLDLSVTLELRAALFEQARRRAYCISSPAVGFGTLIAASVPGGAAMDPFLSLLRLVGQRGLPATMGRFFAAPTLEAMNRELPRGKVPSIAIGPAMCAVFSATEVVVALTARAGVGWREPLCLPRVLVVDALDVRHEVVPIDDLLAAMDGAAAAGSAE